MALAHALNVCLDNVRLTAFSRAHLKTIVKRLGGAYACQSVLGISACQQTGRRDRQKGFNGTSVCCTTSPTDGDTGLGGSSVSSVQLLEVALTSREVQLLEALEWGEIERAVGIFQDLQQAKHLPSVHVCERLIKGVQTNCSATA
jgi:hypothetical protein